MSKELTKPFTVNIERSSSNESNTEKENQKQIDLAGQKVTIAKNNKVKPFQTVDTPKEKLYLLLKYYNQNDNEGEETRDFEFFIGTSQDLYDHIKQEILDNEEFNGRCDLDLMKSRVYVDAPNITIGQKCTLYMFMDSMKVQGRVIDDTSFDIHDYYYELEE